MKLGMRRRVKLTRYVGLGEEFREKYGTHKTIFFKDTTVGWGAEVISISNNQVQEHMDHNKHWNYHPHECTYHAAPRIK